MSLNNCGIYWNIFVFSWVRNNRLLPGVSKKKKNFTMVKSWKISESKNFQARAPQHPSTSRLPPLHQTGGGGPTTYTVRVLLEYCSVMWDGRGWRAPHDKCHAHHLSRTLCVLRLLFLSMRMGLPRVCFSCKTTPSSCSPCAKGQADALVQCPFSWYVQRTSTAQDVAYRIL